MFTIGSLMFRFFSKTLDWFCRVRHNRLYRKINRKFGMSLPLSEHALMWGWEWTVEDWRTQGQRDGGILVIVEDKTEG